ncbi:AraC family transcriptional regulator [Roseateles sp. SL47]|nr:AraC family transcriptional regulator [Roseateles sp. SL47]WAC71713.1 AraC family transcriptional regulator [Roseateles sp. SL47]
MKLPEVANAANASDADLVSRLLLDMRLSGVLYRRSLLAPGQGLRFDNAQGRGQFHFAGQGPLWLCSPEGQWHGLRPGDAVLLPRGGTHVVATAKGLPNAQIQAFSLWRPPGASDPNLLVPQHPSDRTRLLFSACMGMDLGGLQPLVQSMPEVMHVGTLMECSPEIQPLLAAMERESAIERPGFAGVLARLADVVAALIVRAWVLDGCPGADGWVQALRDPRLGRALAVMHEAPGQPWTVASLAEVAGQSRSVFAQAFQSATCVTPLRYLTALRMRLALQRLGQNRQSVESVATELGYGSLAAFSRAFKRVTGQAPGAVRALAWPLQREGAGSTVSHLE